MKYERFLKERDWVLPNPVYEYKSKMGFNQSLNLVQFFEQDYLGPTLGPGGSEDTVSHPPIRTLVFRMQGVGTGRVANTLKSGYILVRKFHY